MFHHVAMLSTLFLAAVALTLSAPVGAQEAKSPEGYENLALGATYTLQPTPGYALCTDPDDLKQLTDGVYTSEYFWAGQSTVGWQNAKTVIITLDLGETAPIRGLSLNTAAGTAGVTWPLAIRVFVGDEDKNFYLAGDLLAMSAVHGEPEASTYGVHRYWTDELETHGRYVSVVVTNQPFTFVDEIEVYKGASEWLSTPHTGEPIADIGVYTADNLVRDGINRRLRQDVGTLRDKVVRSGLADPARAAILGELSVVEDIQAKAQAPETEAFRAVLPLNALHRRIFACQARLWNEQGITGLQTWNSGLWEALSHLADPPKGGAASVDVVMMQNEYRAAAFNLSNASLKDEAVPLRIEGLPEGTNPGYITVHEVAWTDTASGIPVASALPEARRSDGEWVIDVPAGMTRQVWLTFHPTSVAPGSYEGRIVLGRGAQTVPVSFDLFPFRFPDKPTLDFGGWDYTNGDSHRGINPENRDLVLQHLKERFVNVPWATNQVIPRGAYDAKGHMTTKPETEAFDTWIGRWPEARYYCVFAAVGETFNSWPKESAEFRTAVGAWASFWANHAASKGIDPGRLNLLLLDEPHEDKHNAIIVAWAEAIRLAGAGLTVWEDPTHRGLSASHQAMAEASDVLCPNRVIYLRGDEAYKDFFREMRDGGKRLEFYSCSGPSTLLDPYSYYRLQAWTCWKEGATASYFWAFGDNAGISPWNEYLAPRQIYTLSFLDDTSIVPAKMMEGAREGVEDYEYFVMLRAAVAAAPAGAARDRGAALLANLADRVLEGGTSDALAWHDDLDRSLADVGRVQILEALVALNEAP